MHKNSDFTQNLRLHSSSFYLASLWLSAETRHAAAKLYYFCRYLDDLADKPHSHNSREIESILKDIQGQKSNHPISGHMLELIEQYHIPHNVPIALIHGIQKDLNNIQMTTKKSLLSYAYEVAGTVGIMMAHVLNTPSLKAQHHAIDLSIAMQLTNIARDVYEDARLGRRYLPAEWIGSITPEDIIHPSPGIQIKINQGIHRIIRLSEDYYDSGINGISYLPKKYQASIHRAAALYREIGFKIQHAQNSFQKEKTRVSKLKKLYLLTCKKSNHSPVFDHSISLHNDIKHFPFTHHA